MPSSSSEKKVIFTGGGSGGHVMPALTLIEKLRTAGFGIHYIGDRKSIERELAAKAGLKFSPIFTGKLRRYISLENFIDIFKVGIGFIQCLFIFLRLRRKNTLVFSTGGFVSVPVVMAAKVLRFTVYIHEQTTRVGLANKICGKIADKVFVSFEESLKYFPRAKVTYSGYPLRDACYDSQIGEVEILGRRLNDLEKPILFATGGGNGSFLINQLIEKNLDRLCEKYVVVHQVGKNYIEKFEKMASEIYLPLDFVHGEMIDLYKLADVVISRAGAGTVSELIALKKPSLFIPLKIAQKNEQFHNAMAASKLIGSVVVEEDKLNEIDLLSVLNEISSKPKGTSSEVMPNGTEELISQISEYFHSS